MNRFFTLTPALSAAIFTIFMIFFDAEKEMSLSEVGGWMFLITALTAVVVLFVDTHMDSRKEKKVEE